MDLSIVTTLYYSSPYLNEFYERISQEAQQITDRYEIIFVNDGSPDNSLEIVISFYEQDEKIRIIDLSRNFGHHKAMMTGLAYAQGNLVFLIDSDLEEEPELLSLFYEQYQKLDVDVVYGVQKKRKGNLWEKISGNIFYKLFNFLSYYHVPSNLITARLMSKRYVKALIEHKDQEIFLAGLWAITGFKQIPLEVNKYFKGTSSYNFIKKMTIFINAITSFSNKPLILIFYLGSLISFCAGISGIILVIKRLFFASYLSGWASLIVSIWFLGGITIFCIGLLGIYLSKVFMETKNRPYTIIRNFYTHEN